MTWAPAASSRCSSRLLVYSVRVRLGSCTLLAVLHLVRAPESARPGAMMALADLTVAAEEFWTGAPASDLPIQADLPVDLLLRQLPDRAVIR